MQLPDKKTKIVCTIGPASQSRETLTEMIRSGMDVTRLNFAHGDFDSHRQTIANIRAAAVGAGRRVAIMGDLPGPKMRIGRLEDDRVELERGQTFILDSDETPGDASRVSMSFPRLPTCVVPGDRIFLSDGFIQLVVQKATADAVECQVAVGGELRSNKGLNLPGIDLGISAFTEDDRQYLLFAGEQKLDAVSQSFVENASDLKALREAAAAIDFRPLVIAKIERSRAVDNLDAILGVADGLMVARGDLGVEIPIEEIAVTQKEIIRKANLFGKPVITATHMLESMVSNRRPTRAEATDVANAILDGTDCVMLSEETATGQYPVDAVRVMNRIAQVTEPYNSSSYVIDMLNKEKIGGQISKAELISLSIYRSVEALSPVAVLTPTLSGATPRVVTRFRLPVWIVAVSPDEQVCQQLQFSYGVHPVLEHQRPDSWEWYARDWLAQHAITTGQVLLTKGSGTGPTGGTDQIEFIDLSAPPSESIVW